MANLVLFSLPPPSAATVISMVSPDTSSTCVAAGVLSRVFTRPKAGSATIAARSRVFGFQIRLPDALVGPAGMAYGRASLEHVPINRIPKLLEF